MGKVSDWKRRFLPGPYTVCAYQQLKKMLLIFLPYREGKIPTVS